MYDKTDRENVATIIAKEVLALILPLSKEGAFTLAVKSQIANEENVHCLLFLYDDVLYAYADDYFELIDFALAIAESLDLRRKTAAKLLKGILHLAGDEIVPEILNQRKNIPGATLQQKIYHQPELLNAVIIALIQAAVDYAEKSLPEDTARYKPFTQEELDTVELDESDDVDTLTLPIVPKTLETVYFSLYTPSRLTLRVDTTLPRHIKLIDENPENKGVQDEQ